jgi:hypothetical protein
LVDGLLPARLNGDGYWLLGYADGQRTLYVFRALAVPTALARARPRRNADFSRICRAWLGEQSCTTWARPNGRFMLPIIARLHPLSLDELYPGNQTPPLAAARRHPWRWHRVVCGHGAKIFQEALSRRRSCHQPNARGSSCCCVKLHLYISTDDDDSLSAGDRSSSGPTVATLEADDFPGFRLHSEQS